MAFVTSDVPTQRLRIEATPVAKHRPSYIWRPGNKRMVREH